MMKYLKSRYFYSWIAVIVTGSLLVNALHLSSLQVSTFPSGQSPAPGVLILMSLAAGTVAGACQWLLLRRHVKKAYEWIIATAIGTMLSMTLPRLFVSGLISLLAPAPDLQEPLYGVVAWLGPLLISGTMSIVQWLFWVSRVQNAWRWIVFSMLAAFVVPKLMRFEGLVVPGSQSLIQSLLAVVFWGVFVGAITGIPVVDFLKESTNESAA